LVTAQDTVTRGLGWREITVGGAANESAARSGGEAEERLNLKTVPASLGPPSEVVP